MDINVSLSSMIGQALASTNQQTAQLAHLQSEASTGNRLNEPSDGPADTVAMLAAQAQDSQFTAYLGNIQSATTSLNASVSALQSVNSIFTQARDVALQGSQTTNSQGGLSALADQVDQLLAQLVQTANSKSGNQYLFSGTASRTQPYVVSAVNGQGLPHAVTYQGSTGGDNVIIGQQLTVQTLLPGSEVFQNIQRGTSVYAGNTGATAGQGTDSGLGTATLQVRHTSTSYASGSGVTAGTGSASGDTVLGAAGANTLTIADTSGNGSAGTVSLNGGPTLSWTSADTNLEVNGPNGQTVFVNTTAIAAGFSGTVAITSSGTLSTDGGATTVPIDFSSSQDVTDSTTGAVTHVDSSNIHAVGDDTVAYTGTQDAFQTLIALRNDLRNTAGLTATQQAAAVSSTLGDLQRISDSVVTAMGAQSASLQSLQNMQTNDQNLQLSARQLASTLGGADMADVTIKLQEQQNQLEFTLAAVAKVLSINLLDFLH